MDGTKNLHEWLKEDNFLKIRLEVLILPGIKKLLQYSEAHKELKETEASFSWVFLSAPLREYLVMSCHSIKL